VVFGALTRGVPQTAALTVNLAAGAVAAGAAGQSTDMLNDLRTGYLLRASARAQFLAQLVGSAASVGTSVALFVLFARAAPCILTGASPCAYGAPVSVILQADERALTRMVRVVGRQVPLCMRMSGC
jgi:uncharacterized oligopeptide transporter (OPT) family protein